MFDLLRDVHFAVFCETAVSGFGGPFVGDIAPFRGVVKTLWTHRTRFRSVEKPENMRNPKPVEMLPAGIAAQLFLDVVA
jgi:hypothetical protein